MQDVQQIIERLQLLKYGGLALIFAGLTLSVFFAARDITGAPYKLYLRYVSYVERQLHRQFIFKPGNRVVIGQAAALFVILLFCTVSGVEPLYTMMMLALAGGGPLLYIERMRRKRVAKIEAQLDGFLLALANALKATPSLGKAFGSVRNLVLPPLREEVDLALKEMRVGSTLDQALLLMAQRVGSRQVDSALSALLIGRQVGGNLPKILDTTSSTLREMSRLDAVVRAKTAEGKAQLTLLSIFPLLLILSFSMVKSDYFEPLTDSFTGYMVIAVAAGCWLASLVVARKIVSVDI
jgi:tight adherence protein B